MAGIQKLQLKRECLSKVRAALGRDISENEASDMLADVRAAMADLRNADTAAWNSMTHRDRVHAASKLVQERMKEEAGKIKQRAYLEVLAQANVQRSLDLQRQRGYRGFSAAGMVLQEVDRKVSAAQASAESDFLLALDKKQRGILGIMIDKDFEQAVVREVFGIDSGSKKAKDVARVWETSAEAGRLRFNRAGGNLGKIEHYIPQTHDDSRMAHAAEILAGRGKLRQFANSVANTVRDFSTQEVNRAAWVNFIAPLLDRSRYVDLNGNLMNDESFYSMLGNAFDTIVRNGAQDFEPSLVSGSRGGGGAARANRGDLHRALHFKDADSFLTYHNVFGHGTIFDNMRGALKRTAKDSVLLEELGPNPNNMVRGIKRVARAEVDRLNGSEQGKLQVVKMIKNGIHDNYFDSMWSTLNGEASVVRPDRVLLATVSGAARNLEVVGKLQSTMLSSVNDFATYFISARVFKVPFATAVVNLCRSLGPAGRELAARGGLMADALASSMNRWGANNVGSGWTGMLANATMKLSLLDGFTNWIRRASMMNMMGTMANLVRNDYASLRGIQKRSLDRIGVTERDWQIWQMADSYRVGGIKFLTRDDILEAGTRTGNPIAQRDIDHAATSYLALLRDESGLASLAPDLGTRALANVKGGPGTLFGEAMRNILLFKSFPIGMMRRHLERMSDLAQTEGQASRVKYAAMVFFWTTVFGGISVQLKALAAGRDLQDPTSKDFILQAVSTGGGAGFINDLIAAGLDGENAYGSPNFLRFMGPVVGTVLDTSDVLKAYYNEWMNSESGGLYNRASSADSKAIRLIRGHAPFVNLWYLKGLFDRAVYNDIMEATSPGYNARVEAWHQRNLGQGYWWSPREIVPHRAPQVSEAPRD